MGAFFFEHSEKVYLFEKSSSHYLDTLESVLVVFFKIFKIFLRWGGLLCPHIRLNMVAVSERRDRAVAFREYQSIDI